MVYHLSYYQCNIWKSEYIIFEVLHTKEKVEGGLKIDVLHALHTLLDKIKSLWILSAQFISRHFLSTCTSKYY